jgi:hypothetical protein
MFAEYELNGQADSMPNLCQKISKDFPKSEIQEDSQLLFASGLITLLESGEHEWTIRFKPGCIRIPFMRRPTQGNVIGALKAQANAAPLPIGYLIIPQMAAGHIIDWPLDHPSIAGSGWKSKAHMIQGLSDIYEPIYKRRLRQSDLLTAFFIQGFRRLG